jgi:uncharacterized phage-associated protein
MNKSLNPHRDVFDYAKYFIKHNTDTRGNTLDANMKLQKLLVFANLYNIAEHGEPLFNEDIYAFRQGCVVEKVRQRYKNDFDGLIKESEQALEDFTDEELRVLAAVNDFFGNISARELSELNHAFEFWKTAYDASVQPSGYRNKSKGVVSVSDMRLEAPRVKAAIDAAERSKASGDIRETINGVDFYYDANDTQMTDELLDMLYLFSRSADENAYTVSSVNGKVAIY